MVACARRLARRCRRSDFAAIVFLFAIVWSTDILGYFAGRAIGGPKLMPAVSPKKTWAGAIAGTVGAVVVAALVGALVRPRAAFRDRVPSRLLLVGGGAGRRSCSNSWIKRHFGAKDASHLIPGHGGVMDRLDGFWAAALVGAAIGFARGGMDAAARGLLLW